MILDRLDKLSRYAALHPGVSRAASVLCEMFSAIPEVGKHVIDGDRLFIIVARDQGRGHDRSPLEFHRRYIDIQVVLSGQEEIGWRALADCRELSEPYVAERDIGFYADRPDTWLSLPAGHFAIFFPEDAHAPLAATGSVCKAVAKVAVDW